MSNDNAPAIIEEPITDLTEKDLIAINQYIADGLPFIATVDEVKLARSLDLYLQGRTYAQISMILNVKKSMILFLSNKFKWFDIRREYLVDMEASSKQRVLESKIMNQDMLMQLQQMWRKKFGSNITKYFATDNVEFANAIDLKEIDKYLKTVEMLHRLGADPNKEAKPLIGLNMGDGVTVTKNEDNSIDITPKQKAIGDVLKQFADARREEDRLAQEAKEAKKL